MNAYVPEYVTLREIALSCGTSVVCISDPLVDFLISIVSAVKANVYGVVCTIENRQAAFYKCT